MLALYAIKNYKNKDSRNICLLAKNIAPLVGIEPMTL